MAADYQLDTHAFIALLGPPEWPTEQVELETRAGTDGVSIWKLGLRGEPFQIGSVVEAANAIAAAKLLKRYRQLIGRDPVDMVWAGAPVEGVVYTVLRVDPVQGGIGAMLLGIGGTVGPGVISRGVCRCVWTLVGHVVG